MRTRQKSSASTNRRRSPHNDRNPSHQNGSSRRSPHRSRDNSRNSTHHRNDRNRPSRSTRKPERYRDNSPQRGSVSPPRDTSRTQPRGEATQTTREKGRQVRTNSNNNSDQQTAVLQQILNRLDTLEQHMPKNASANDSNTTDNPQPSTSRESQANDTDTNNTSSQQATSRDTQSSRHNEKSKPDKRSKKDEQINKDENTDSSTSDLDQTTQHVPQKSKRRNEETDSSSSDDEHYFATLPSSSKRRRLNNKGESYYDSSSDSEDDFSAYDKPITSFGTLVGEGLQQKIKLKILADKFVEMSSLLPQHRTNDPEEFIMKQGKNSAATFVKNRPKTTLSISKWNEAFEIYIAIYLENAHSSSDMLKLARSLLTYKKEINNLCKLGYDWLAYDHHFRTDRAAKPFSWATTRHDLMMEYQPQRKNFRPYNTQQQSKPYAQKKSLRTKDGNHIPFGYCMAFHTRNSRCETQNCSFQHSCPRCATRHPIYRPCNNNTNTRTKEDTERSKK